MLCLIHDLILFFLQQTYSDANIEEKSLSDNVVLIQEQEPIAGPLILFRKYFIFMFGISILSASRVWQ